MAKDPNELGALWEHTNAQGKYMTGDIGGTQVVIFPAKDRRNERAPHWRVLKARPKSGNNAPPPSTEFDDDGVPY